MCIQTHLNEQSIKKLNHLVQISHSSVSSVIQRAIDDYYTRTSNKHSVANAEILVKTGFVGCGEASSELSTDYKSELYHIMAQKHGDC